MKIECPKCKNALTEDGEVCTVCYKKFLIVLELKLKECLQQRLTIVKQERKSIPKYSEFGYNNWDILNLEIGILSEILSNKDIVVSLKSKLDRLNKLNIIANNLEDIYHKYIIEL